MMSRARLIKLWVFLGTVCLPILYFPGMIGFEVPKVWFFWWWVISLMAVLLWEKILTKEKFSWGWIGWFVLARFLVLVVCSLLGADWQKSLWGNYYRADGLVTELFILIFFSCLKGDGKRHYLPPVLLGLAVGNLVSALWAVGQNIWGMDIGFGGKGAGFGQPVFLAGYLLVTAPAVWWMIDHLRKGLVKNVIWILSLALIGGGLWATKATAGLIGFPLVVLAWWLSDRISWKWLLGGFLVVMAVSGWGLANNWGVRYQDKVLFEGRERIFHKAYLAFGKRPVIGWGWANFDHAFESVDWPVPFLHDVYVDKAHSTLVETAVSGGFLGLGVTLLLYGVIGRKLINGKGKFRKVLLVMFLIYLWHTQTNVISIGEEMILWTVAAYA